MESLFFYISSLIIIIKLFQSNKTPKSHLSLLATQSKLNFILLSWLFSLYESKQHYKVPNGITKWLETCYNQLHSPDLQKQKIGQFLPSIPPAPPLSVSSGLLSQRSHSAKNKTGIDLEWTVFSQKFSKNSEHLSILWNKSP